MRISLSSIPYASHISLSITPLDAPAAPMNLTDAFNDERKGSMDRRFIDVPFLQGLLPGQHEFRIGLSPEGRRAKVGQGGKMISSVEIMEYAPDYAFEEGFIGAFPTYSIDGKVTLRPVSLGALIGMSRTWLISDERRVPHA